MRGRGFCGLVPRLLAMWYWFDQEAIEDGARARTIMEQGLYCTVLVGPGGDRCVKKIVREPKWGTSSPSVVVARERRRKQREIASEESKAKAKI